MRIHPSQFFFLPGLFALALALGAGPLNAAENYKASLKAGDQFVADKEYDKALSEYEEAGKLAATPTETALALAKKGSVLFDQLNYPAARRAAEEVLAMQDVRPVARVTAFEVLAKCLMKEDKNFTEAAEKLEEALQLEGVDWAHPTLTVILGDCYRFSGNYDRALETYQRVTELTFANEVIKSISYLNMGLTEQYNLHDESKAKDFYKTAVHLNPALKKEVDTHLSKIP